MFGMVFAFGGSASIVVTDGTIHFKQVIDFLNSGGFALVNESARLDPGAYFSPYGWPYAIDTHKGTHLVYPEAFTVYGAFLYRFLGNMGLLFTIVPAALVTLLLANLMFRELGFSRKTLLGLGLFHLFGTSFFLFNVNYSEIAPGLMLGHLGLYLYIRFHATERLIFAAGAGIAFGAALFMRQEMALAFAVLGLVHFGYVKRFRPDRGSVVLAGGFAVLVGLFLAYNYVLYGQPFGLRTGSISQEDTGGRWRVMFGLLFTGRVFKDAGGFGFFAQFPFLLLLLFRPWRMFQNLEPLPRALFLYGLGVLIIIPLFAPNDGWINWGSRYLALAEVALLGVFFHYRASVAAKAEGTFARKLGNIAVGLLLAWSVLFSLVGALQVPATLKGGQLQRDLLKNRPEKLFLSATGAHYASGILIQEKNILEIQDATGLPRFMDMLRAHGMERFCLVSHSITPSHRRVVDAEIRDILENLSVLRRTHKGGDGIIGLRCYRADLSKPAVFFE